MRQAWRQLGGLLVLALNAVALASPPEDKVDSFASAGAWSLPRLSPDGARLSRVVQTKDEQIVVLRALDRGLDRRTLSVDPVRERVRWCGWAGAEHLLCSTVSPARGRDRIIERTRLYSINSSGQVRELGVGLDDPVRDQVIDLAPNSPGTVLLQHDASGRGFAEVVELDVETGLMRRVVRAHPPIRRWMSNGRGEVVLGIGYDDSRASLHVRGSRREDWVVWIEQALTDVEAIGPLAIAPSDDLYALKHQDGRAALFRLKVGDKPSSAQLVFAHRAYDVGGPVTLDPESGKVLAIQYVSDYQESQALSAQEADRYALINAALPNTTNLIIDRSLDQRRLLVRASSDVDPPSLYLFDMPDRSHRLIGHDYPELEDRPLAPMRPLIYRARDGQPIRAYLTLPRGAEGRNLPAIVLPHGGPETRNWRTFDPLVQFLAAQGYAVLQMNFRGSFGYGAGFAAAGAGQWGGVIHNDITDGARWLVKEGIADPARMCIVGESFGGYAALLGAARESQWYACAVSYAGISDLLALARTTERLADAEVWRQRLGEDSRALWQMSPMARVKTIETPILLMHGRLDPVAPVRQSRRFARALRSNDKSHHYIERGDCDHEMTIESCRIAFFEELRRFLREWTGPGREE